MYKVDNAIILAAGTSSRFAPLSYEVPKSLIDVKGEILIERQIRQLNEAGIFDITLVVGYKKEMFYYLRDKFNVDIVSNDEYLTRNNNSSIYAIKDKLKNTYICSCDNYFSINPFTSEVSESYYSALYSEDFTNEWCMETDENDYITSVKIGGTNSWYMLGHCFWSNEFSSKFREILEKEYDLDETKDKLWESIYIDHLDELRMKIQKYNDNDIYEFDTLDELRVFDKTYVNDTRSVILKNAAKHLSCKEADIVSIKSFKDSNNAAVGFTFNVFEKSYKYNYSSMEIENL